MFSFDPHGASNARFSLFGAVLGSVWITMSLRIWVRMTRRFVWDDVICLFSALLFTGFCTTAMLVEASHDESNKDPSSQSTLSMALSVASVELYLAAMGVLKVSIALFFLRYIEPIWQRRTTYAMTLLNSAVSVLAIVVTVLECGVLPKQNACLPSSTLHMLELSTGISNAATSWAFAIMPIFIMASRSQRLSMHQKIFSGCAILLGGFASVVSVMRVLCMAALSVGSGDYLIPLSVLECGTATIAASAVTLQPLFRCLSLPSSASGHIGRSSCRPRPILHHEPVVYEREIPSKSHFSLFSEASFGPKMWFRSLHDNTQDDRADNEDIRALPNRYRQSTLRKSHRQISSSNMVASQPAAVPARPPPLNRTESQQYLLRNESDSYSSSGAGIRRAGISKPLLMYGGIGQLI